MKRMKQTLAVLCSLGLSIAIAGCGETEEDVNSKEEILGGIATGTGSGSTATKDDQRRLQLSQALSESSDKSKRPEPHDLALMIERLQALGDAPVDTRERACTLLRKIWGGWLKSSSRSERASRAACVIVMPNLSAASRKAWVR